MAEHEPPFLKADGLSSLREQLEERRLEQRDRPGTDTGENTLWGEINLLGLYFERAYLDAYPVTIWKREKPDFHVQDANGHLGLEMTFSMSEIGAENDTRIRRAGIKLPYPSPSTTERISDAEVERMKREQDELGYIRLRGEPTIGLAGDKDFGVLSEQVGKELDKKMGRVQKFEFDHPIHIVLGIESLKHDRPLHLDSFFIPSRTGITRMIDHLAKHALAVMNGPGKMRVTKVVYISGNTILEVLATDERFASNEHLSRLPVAEFIEKGYEED